MGPGSAKQAVQGLSDSEARGNGLVSPQSVCLYCGHRESLASTYSSHQCIALRHDRHAVSRCFSECNRTCNALDLGPIVHYTFDRIVAICFCTSRKKRLFRARAFAVRRRARSL